MRTLLLFIPHYVYTSDLLRTNYIRTLAEKFKIVILSPVFHATPPTEYFQHPNITYLYRPIEFPKFWIRMTKTLRIGLMREFDHLGYFKLRDYAFKEFKRKLMRGISRRLPYSWFSADTFTKLETILLPYSKTFQTYLTTYNPSLVVTCSPGFSDFEAEAIILAKKNRIPTAAINFSWDNLTANAQQIRRPDFLVCWNDIIRNEAITIHHYPPEQVITSGIMRFDHHFEPHPHEISREEFLKSKGLDPARKTIFFSTVPHHTYPHQIEFLKELVRLIAEKRIHYPVNVFIRLHPREDMDPYKEFANIPHWHIEYPGRLLQKYSATEPHKIEMGPEDHANLRASLKYSDVNVNFRSSITLEAWIYNKPVVNLAFHGTLKNYSQDHYIPIMKSGAVRFVENAPELEKALNTYLDRPETDSLNRIRMFDAFIHFKDGKSYARNAAAVETIVSRLANDIRETRA